MIDFSSSSLSCDPIDVGPLDNLEYTTNVHGTFVGGDFLVCSTYTDECFVYDPQSGTWSKNGAPQRIADRYERGKGLISQK